MTSLTVIHNSGFFSCCSVRLCSIIQYCNAHKQVPDIVDSSKQFLMYKYDTLKDITFDLFEHYNNGHTIEYEKHIDITDNCFQGDDYKTVDYHAIMPFIRKYFSPSQKIREIRDNFITKYNIDTNNCIGVYYRGTDKYQEMQLESYDNFYNKLEEVINKEQGTPQILVQSDSYQFIEFMKNKLINRNVIIIDELPKSVNNIGNHTESTQTTNYSVIHDLFATFLILAKCKTLVCNSGNCSIWMMFFRGNASGVYQNYNYKWY